MEIIPLGDSALIVRVREQFAEAPEETLDEVLSECGASSHRFRISLR